MMRPCATTCSPFKVAAAVVVAVGWRRGRFFASVMVIRMLPGSSTAVTDQRWPGAGVVAALHGQQVFMEGCGRTVIENLAKIETQGRDACAQVDFTRSTFGLSLPEYAPAFYTSQKVFELLLLQRQAICTPVRERKSNGGGGALGIWGKERIYYTITTQKEYKTLRHLLPTPKPNQFSGSAFETEFSSKIRVK
jgi:hypothetical protein